MKQFHYYHMVAISPWPILMGMNMLFMIINSVWFFNLNSYSFIGSFNLILILTQWWRDVHREASKQGHHSSKVASHIRWGMLFFIFSEIMFFLSFFWAFFNSSLSPNIELGIMWPPMGLVSINPFDMPLLNTIILLSSGVTITLSHHLLINKQNNNSLLLMLLTVVLGVYFVTLQYMEYNKSFFSLVDSVYSNIFYMTTGFHGVHVMIGTLFIMFMTPRMKNNWFSDYHHIGFENSIWYWHFVDVVWLFLFCFIYWWSF